MKIGDFMSVYENIISILKSNGVKYSEIKHPEVLSSESSMNFRKEAGWGDGNGSKNIIYHAKGNFFHIVTTHDAVFKARVFKKEFGTKDIRFANGDELEANVGCKIGSIPPFGYMNSLLPIYVDSRIFDEEFFMFTPADNCKSIRVKSADLYNVYKTLENRIQYFSFIDEKTIELKEEL